MLCYVMLCSHADVIHCSVALLGWTNVYTAAIAPTNGESQLNYTQLDFIFRQMMNNSKL